MRTIENVFVLAILGVAGWAIYQGFVFVNAVFARMAGLLQ